MHQKKLKEIRTHVYTYPIWIPSEGNNIERTRALEFVAQFRPGHFSSFSFSLISLTCQESQKIYFSFLLFYSAFPLPFLFFISILFLSHSFHVNFLPFFLSLFQRAALKLIFLSYSDLFHRSTQRELHGHFFSDQLDMCANMRGREKLSTLLCSFCGNSFDIVRKFKERFMVRSPLRSKKTVALL